MGEKETATEEAERLKTKTKSNQSNDRTALDADSDDDSDSERLKNKTKSNQSNDRTALDADSDSVDEEAAGDAGRSDVSERATWTSSNPGLAAGRASSGPRQANQGFRSGLEDAGADPGGGGLEDAAINNTKSNIKNREGMFTGEDAGASGIAIGDPGVNGNFTGVQGIAVSDEGVPADKPRPKSS